ncbi:MAG: hypothetical protein ACIAQZ_01175 [Sedimentisphaeraceae bacterium JB056]
MDMKLEKLQDPEKYTGLYIVDFGDHTSVGFTGSEIEMLLESEKYSSVKIYKIHNAYPDGKLELRGVPHEIFQLESGIFFYSHDLKDARNNYKRLLDLAIGGKFPVRAKLHLAHLCDDIYTVALIYAADADDDISRWLLDNDYKIEGIVKGGIQAVSDYYTAAPEVIERHQLVSSIHSKNFTELYSSLKYAVQR